MVTIAVALTAGIVEAIKRAFKMNKRFVPLLSLAIGLVLALIFGEGFTIQEIVVTGIMIGLSASGLYSGVKATAGK